MEYKRCSSENKYGCGELLPMTTEFFSIDRRSLKRGLDGFCSICKKCNKKCRLDNKQKTKEYNAKRYLENKEEIKINGREYKLINKEKIDRRNILYRIENREEINRRGRLFHMENKDRENKKQRERVAVMRELCLDKYGHACIHKGCGIRESELLAFDHKYNDGAKHRREIGVIMYWIVKKNFPDSIQLLCHNHNWLKSLARTRSMWKYTYSAIANRKYRIKVRLEIFTHYGLFCACCGEANFDLLTIDHIGGGGTKHRDEIGGPEKFYDWLRKNGFPKGFRTLCHNCNKSFGSYGYCPHKKESVCTWHG